MESLWHDANGFNEFRFILVWFGSLVAMLGIVAGMVQFPRILLRRRIREVIPDVTDIRFGFVGSNKILFNYKGFRAELQLFGLKHRYLENNSNYTVEDISQPQQTADTHLRIEIPAEMQKALTAARFQMVFTPDVFLLSTEVRPVGPKQCAIRTSNPIMQALTRDEEVLRTLTALQSVTRQRNVVISLRRDFFSVELPDTTNTDERALMTACGVRIFERVLAAAGVDAVEKAAAARVIDDPFRRSAFEELPAGAYEGHARAYLKIEDGCDNFCAYCIIPYARGRVLSLPAERCAEKCAALAAAGYKEIVITGIEIASWGKDLKNGQPLIDAISAMAAAAPEARLHLGSLEPTVVTEDFAGRLQTLNVCPHFHLSLQSGCDATLRRMRRKYDTAGFRAAAERLRAAFPDCGLTADLICGFPGETEEEFAATLAFIGECAFSAMHIFPYSVRPGTKAAAMPDQVPKEEKAARCRRAQAAADRMQSAFLAQNVGRTLSVLFETERGGESRGHAENYAEVSVKEQGLRGLVKKVKITDADGQRLVGCVL